MKIDIQTTINAPTATVWDCYTSPEHITQWNAASDDWHCPSASNDLRVGGKMTSRMEAKDGSMGFDFEGSYEEVIDQELLHYVLEDGRHVETRFKSMGDQTELETRFDAESEHSADMQKQGWQAILDNFKRHVESL